MSDPIFSPRPGRQELFYTHGARVVGYGGAPGTGKTLCMLYHHAYLLDFETQRWKRGEIVSSDAWVMFFRRTMPNLRQVMKIAHHTFPHMDDPAPKWSADEKTWTYPCGLVFQFAAMEHALDYRNFLGPSYVAVSMDELPEFTEEQQAWIDTRIRTKHACLKPFLNFRWGANPEGEGLPWVRRRFLDPYRTRGIPFGTTLRRHIKTPSGKRVVRDEVFIHARPEDNDLIYGDGEYEASLWQSKPHIARALLAGDFYFTAGGLFADFWRPDLHICENHMPPPNTFRFRSCDFGIHSPSSITWWYVDYDGCMTAYYQLWLRGLTADKQAARIREVERFFGDWDDLADRSTLTRSPIDAHCFARTGTSGPTIAQEFRRHGVSWIPSAKDRYNGIAELCRRLSSFVDLGDGTQKPSIRWMKRCSKSVEILPITPADRDNPGEVAPNFDGRHLVDDHLFSVQSNPLRAPRLRVLDGGLSDDDFETRRLPLRIADIG